MPDALSNLRNELRKLTGTNMARGRPATKTAKAKCMTLISDYMAKKSAIAALTHNSTVELCTGAEHKPTDFLSWNGLAVEIISVTGEMLEDVKTSKKKTTTIRKEYIACLRSLMKHAPHGSIRCVVPSLLTWMYDWIKSDFIRNTIAVDIWQLFRDILTVDENRAMLSPGIFKTWAIACTEQILCKGDHYYKDDQATNFAHEAFVLLAKHVPTFDILTQQHGKPSSEMYGLDFGYVVLVELSVQMLYIPKKMSKVRAKHVQSTALKCIATVLEKYTLDFTACAAAKTILTHAIPAVLALWTEDRRHHEVSVDAAKQLIRLATCNRDENMLQPIRERIEADFGGGGSEKAASIVRNKEDILQSKIEAAGLLFAPDDILQKIESNNIVPLHLTTWLRVLTFTLRNNCTIFENESDIPALGTRVVTTVRQLFTKKLSSQSASSGKMPVHVLIDCCDVVRTVTGIVQRVVEMAGDGIMISDSKDCEDPWARIYRCFLEQLVQIKYANSYKSYSSSNRSRKANYSSSATSTAEKPLMECLMCLLNSGLMDKSGLNSSYGNSSSSAREKSFSWISIFSEATNITLPDEAVLFARAHLSVTGIRDNANFRSILFRLMLRFCEPRDSGKVKGAISLQNAVAAVLGLSRGICPVPIDEYTRFDEIPMDMNIVSSKNIDAFMYNFCHANINSEISGNTYVQRLRAAMMVSGSEYNRALFNHPHPLEHINGYRTNSNSDVAYFNVDASVTNNIEREFMLHILGVLDGIINEPDNDNNKNDNGDDDSSPPWIFGDEDSAPLHSTSFAEQFKNRYELFSDEEIDIPLKKNVQEFVHVAFLVATYLEQGVTFGVIRCEELEGDKEIARMLVVLMLLLKKLAQTTSVKDLAISPSSSDSPSPSPAILACLITASCTLISHWRESHRESSISISNGQSEVKNVDEKPLTSFMDLLSVITGNIAQGMCTFIEKESRGVVNTIKSFNSSSGEPARGTKRTRNGASQKTPSRKRPKTVLKSIPKKKSLAWSDDESQSDDEKSIGDEDDGGNESDGSSRNSNGDSNEGFDDDNDDPFEPIGTPPRNNSANEAELDDSTYVVRSVSQILISIQKFPQLKEVVLDKCKSCLQRIKVVEQRLDDDVRNAALMASGIVNPHYLNIRSYLWEVLFHGENKAAVDVAAITDVIHFASKWKIIEDVACEVIEFYFDTMSTRTRKHYAPLTCHERLRYVFLGFASRALRSFSRAYHNSNNSYRNSNDSGNISSVFELDTSLLSSLIGIHDTFRSRDGFYMPRTTRAAFAYFSVELLHCLMPQPVSSQEVEIMTDVDNALTKPSQSIREMLCKQLSDADASVRIAVAGAFRIFSNLTERNSNTRNRNNNSKGAESSLFEAFRANESSMDVEHNNNSSSISWDGWNLSTRDDSELHNMREAFEVVGKSSRAISNLVMLGEVGIESPKNLPVCLFEILQRVANDSKIEEYAYNIIIRLCGMVSIEGPQELFSVVERILLQKWFASFRGFTGLKRFPVKLVHDANRNKGGVLYDWMREYTDKLLPFILLSDQDGGDLENTRSYCSALGIALEEMLQAYVGPMCRVFPMMFTAGYDRKGSSLWGAIDAALDGEAGKLLKGSEEAAFVSLLTSISTRDVSQNSGDAPTAFLRDCSGIHPPFYDPTVIMTALQSMCTKESQATKVLSRRTMKGALFDSSLQESEEDNGRIMKDIVKKFCGSNSEILPGALISIILAVWKMLCGPPTPVHPQNRIDAFLIVGTLWKIVGEKILEEPNRRKIFLKLLLQGFRFSETALNALWLFKVFTDLTISRTSVVDLDMLDSDTVGIPDSEIEYYQLLSASVPMLVDLSVAKKETPSKSAAVDAVKHLVQAGSDRRMWTSLAAIDLVPNIDDFKEVRRQQDKAWKNSVEGKSDLPIKREMKAFVASERRAARENRHIVLTISKLKRLRSALVEENRALIGSTIQEESWLRSEGLSEDMLGLLNDVLGHLIDLTFEMSLIMSPSYSQNSHTRLDQYIPDSDHTPHAIVQECTWLIGMLGTIHPTSLVFESRKRRQDERICAVADSDHYDESKDGVLKAIPALQMLFFGDSPLVARVAFSSLVAVMGSSEGRELYGMYKDDLEPYKEFRVIARKKGMSHIRSESKGFFDCTTGSRLEPEFLGIADEELWVVPRDWSNDESPVNRWVRQLSAAMASSSSNKAFQQMAALCFVSAHFSRLMLPFLLMNVIEKHKEDPTCPVLSRVIEEQIFSDATVPLEAVRMVVHALDICCQIELKTLRMKGVGKLFSNKAEHLRLYRLDIPYIVVADAAARVGMYFSAIRYATLHIDYESVSDERNSISKGSTRSSKRSSSICPASNARENARRSVEHILVLAADNINEPDMKRALGRDGDLLTTASQMAVLDSSWGRSVGTLDALCNQPNGPSAADSSQEISLGNSAELPLKQELMLVKSMNGLGCTNLVSKYWDSLKQKVISYEASNLSTGNATSIQYLELVDELNELRYAAAWKLGDWEVPGVIVPVSKGRNLKKVVGHHQTIHKCLAALATGDSNSMLSSLQSGRESQAVWFGRMDTSESAHRLYEMAGRVRVLNKMESVINVVTANSDLTDRTVPSDGSTTRSQFVGSSHMLSDSQSDRVLKLLGCKAEISTTGYDHGGWDTENTSIRDLTLDLQNSIARCIGSPSIVARVSANVAGDILARGGSGSWSRAATALGTELSVSLSKACSIDAVSWKLQNARLRWTSSSDGRSKQKALSDVKALIENDLGGTFSERPTSQTYLLKWDNFSGNDDDLVSLVRAKACQIVSSWSAEIRAEEPVFLFSTYLELGLKAFESKENHVGRDSAHYFMAKFADSQITSIDNYRKTKNYDVMVQAIADTEKRLKHYEKVKAGGGTPAKERRGKLAKNVPRPKMQRDLNTLIRTTKKHLVQDQQRLLLLRSKYRHWQLMACRHYACALLDGISNYLRSSFRLVALWLDSGEMRNNITTDLINGNRNSYTPINVPSDKLLPLFPQMSSRLGGTENDVFQGSLSATLEKMARKFPNHCLWQLLALSNSTREPGTDEKLASFYRGDQDKKDRADYILARLQTEGSDTINQMKKVADAYILLSETSKGEKEKKTSLDIHRSDLCRLKGSDLDKVTVPTMGLPMYGFSESSYEPPYIISFDKSAKICNGLSQPLAVKCLGSDGKNYSQLVKGRDDLRGDAVMEQMFTIFNELLRRDPSASQRNLVVRTYRIVPLSPFSGIMQFVTNTDSFNNVLVVGGRKSLHERYRPHDWTHVKMTNGCWQGELRYSKDLRVNWLQLNWQKIQPVFRYFFLERWPDPVDWYTRQLAYTRSVAVMSIVGFILGIGDRHLSNVLLDTEKGEIVHIDFGVAFEQGKLLPTPELMPFRLSRDFVDGFGISGVDGTFRRCCEVTLDVLRRNKDVLLTVIEVLLHDPMYSWALTPERILKEQLEGEEGNMENTDLFGELEKEGSTADNSKKESGSEQAQRALRRIAEKLDGLEDTERLSVQAHVARLIDEARSFQVLASVYPGWGPWI